MKFSGRALTELRGPMSQQELSEKADVSVFQISRLENGHHQPELATIAKLAQALDVRFEDLLEANGEPV